jgi:NAD(P)H-dependent FMN reductase
MSTILTRPHIVVLSGSLTAGSRSERLAGWCAQECRRREATASLLCGADLEFPFYRAGAPHGAGVARLLAELAKADGLIMVSPAYHGSLSGLLKNALDYVNELAGEERPFLDGRPIGCIALAAGAQGAASTLAGMRTIAHALRGWPTPLGIALHGGYGEAGGTGAPDEEHSQRQLIVMIDQVLSLASTHQQSRSLQRDFAA